MYYTGWSSSTGEADWGLRPLFASEAWAPKLNNMSFYKSDVVDAQLAKALVTVDDKEKAALYKTAQEADPQGPAARAAGHRAEPVGACQAPVGCVRDARRQHQHRRHRGVELIAGRSSCRFLTDCPTGDGMRAVARSGHPHPMLNYFSNACWA
jgi:hypothetical protein